MEEGVLRTLRDKPFSKISATFVCNANLICRWRCGKSACCCRLGTRPHGPAVYTPIKWTVFACFLKS